MTEKKDNTEFMSCLQEVESMFFRACEVADTEEVDELANKLNDFTSAEFTAYKNGDVLLALCGFLSTYSDWLAEEANMSPRAAMMLLQVGMQRAHIAAHSGDDDEIAEYSESIH